MYTYFYLPADYKSTKLLGSAPSHIIEFLTQEDISYNNHFRGITSEVINPLNPNSDKHLISPYSITTW